MFVKEVIKYSDNIAIISDQEDILTYKELSYQSNLLAKEFSKRSLIFSYCENTLGSLIGYYSFMNNGHVPLLLDAKIDIKQSDHLIDLYQPNYLWIPNELLEHQVAHRIIYSNWNYSLLEIHDRKVDLHKNLSLLLTTSGSTGSPKLVRLTADNIISNAKSIATYLQIDEKERPITSLPMNYSYGLSILNSHLIKGASILLTNYSVVQKEFWGFAKNQKATSIAGVPYTYQMLKMLRFANMNLPDLKIMTQAGGKLAPNLVKEFAEFAIKNGKQFFVMYGQTEATARMSYLPFESSFDKSASIGIAIPGGEFLLKDLNEATEINENNKEGELIFRGPNVSLGYATNVLDLNKGDENAGTLFTGDIAYKDEDGFYFITGRIKRFIKIFGNRINLDEVEQILKSANIDCACDGIDDKMIIYVIEENNTKIVIDYLTSIFKLNFRAFEVKVISEIPKNSAGKVLYSKLKEVI